MIHRVVRFWSELLATGQIGEKAIDSFHTASDLAVEQEICCLTACDAP